MTRPSALLATQALMMRYSQAAGSEPYSLRTLRGFGKSVRAAPHHDRIAVCLRPDGTLRYGHNDI